MSDETKKIDERFLVITGKICVEKDIDFGKDVRITLVGGLVKTEYEDNQDGTFDKIMKVKGAVVEQCDKVA